MAAENCLGAAGGPTSSVKYSIVEPSDMLTPSYKLTEILRRVESVRKIIFAVFALRVWNRDHWYFFHKMCEIKRYYITFKLLFRVRNVFCISLSRFYPFLIV